jgi:nanoRNase/pAp phosphatase (c-di-AMP/oligoRNAs hydrolase)
MSAQKFRLVTRSDFDGLVCAVLLNELALIDDILFVHPKDMQDGKIAITARDICTNLPYVRPPRERDRAQCRRHRQPHH